MSYTFSAGIDFRHQISTSKVDPYAFSARIDFRHQISTSKVDPHAFSARIDFRHQISTSKVQPPRCKGEISFPNLFLKQIFALLKLCLALEIPSFMNENKTLQNDVVE